MTSESNIFGVGREQNWWEREGEGEREKERVSKSYVSLCSMSLVMVTNLSLFSSHLQDIYFIRPNISTKHVTWWNFFFIETTVTAKIFSINKIGNTLSCWMLMKIQSFMDTAIYLFTWNAPDSLLHYTKLQVNFYPHKYQCKRTTIKSWAETIIILKSP